MKEVITDLLDKLCDNGILSAAGYIFAVLWFGYIGRLIFVSNANTFIKIMLFIGCLAYGFDYFIQHHMKDGE